jgi:hypothetical protein
MTLKPGILVLWAWLFVPSIAVFGYEKMNTKPNHTGFIENKGQIHDQDYKPNPEVKYLLNS